MHENTLRIARVLVWTGTIAALAALAAGLASGPAYQVGLWNYRTGFTVLRWSVYVAATAGAIALIGCGLATAGRQFRTALIGIAGVMVAFALTIPSWELQKNANRVPRIHDITTDTDHPPQFVALLPVRQKSANGAEYGGEKIARKQRRAYPDIQPVVLPDPPARAFERALAVAGSLGWEIVAAVPAEGRIEATDTTRWFRFKDDIVIRVTPEGAGSRIDIRSASRLGRGDIGTNARRIRNFFAALNAGP
jgi:uncharacterized protein (DUF1499 family)